MGRKRKHPIEYVPIGSRLVFMKQTVIQRTLKDKIIRPKALYKCSCGSVIERGISAIQDGHTKSCGCYNREMLSKRKTHGLSGTPLYDLWATIKNRCYNINEPSYKEYGARGVIMCDEWKENPVAFIEWANANGWEKGLQIDKDIIAMNLGIDPLIYSPERCQFVTPKKNGTATRKSRFIEFNGRKQTLAQWSDELGINRSTILLRLDIFGYTVEQALTKGWRGRKNKTT